MLKFEEMGQMAAVGGGMVFGAFLMFCSPHSHPQDATAKVYTPNPKPPTTSLIVDLSQASVFVKQGDLTVAKYPVAVGRDGWETPIGAFRVTDMQVNPTWKSPFTGEVYPPGTNNPIGDFWIAFTSTKRGLVGFHGTNREQTVGQAVSSGCLRMKRSDLHKLYAAVKIGTPVIVEQ